MTDPFRAELNAEYIVRERHDWAANERLARAPRPRAGLGTLLASLTGLFYREGTPQPSAQVPTLSRRERPAA